MERTGGVALTAAHFRRSAPHLQPDATESAARLSVRCSRAPFCAARFPDPTHCRARYACQGRRPAQRMAHARASFFKGGQNSPVNARRSRPCLCGSNSANAAALLAPGLADIDT